MTGCDGKGIATHHVGLFVRFHPDAVTGSMNEIVAPACINQHCTRRCIHRLAACADDSRHHTSFLRATQIAPCASNVCRWLTNMDATSDVAAIAAHRAAEIAQHDVAMRDDSLTWMVVRACCVVAGSHDRKVHHIVTLGEEPRRDIG